MRLDKKFYCFVSPSKLKIAGFCLKIKTAEFDDEEEFVLTVEVVVAVIVVSFQKVEVDKIVVVDAFSVIIVVGTKAVIIAVFVVSFQKVVFDFIVVVEAISSVV